MWVWSLIMLLSAPLDCSFSFVRITIPPPVSLQVAGKYFNKNLSSVVHQLNLELR